jgi:MFS family permease
LSAALGVAVFGSFLHFVGTLMQPLQEAYGWVRGDIALGLTLITVMSPFINLIVGALVDRVGARRIALCGSISFGASFAVWGLAGPALWTWYLFCVAFALLSHFASSVVWTMMVVKRFNAQRGLALAITLSGSGLTIALTPSLALMLDYWFGVRRASRFGGTPAG